jgi:hypothetical protein
LLTSVQTSCFSEGGFGGPGGRGGKAAGPGFTLYGGSISQYGNTGGVGGSGGLAGQGLGGGFYVAGSGATVTVLNSAVLQGGAYGGGGGTGGSGGPGAFAGFRGLSAGFFNHATGGHGGNGGTGAYGSGGGILMFQGALTLADSTLALVKAGAGFGGPRGAGGLAGPNDSKSGTAGVAGGPGDAAGGGVYLGGGSLRLDNDTVAFNSRENSLNGLGDGIDQVGGNVLAVSTLIGDNGTQDLAGNLSAYNSLIQNNAGAISGSGDLIGLDPALDPNGPVYDGGITPTIALQAGSPALGAGWNVDGLYADQRGAGPRTGLSGTDIGSYQRDASNVIVGPTASLSAAPVTTSTAAGQNPYTFTVTISDDHAIAAASLAGLSVLVYLPGYNGSVYATVLNVQPTGPTDAFGDAPGFNVTCQITPPGGAWSPADNGTYFVDLGAVPISDLAGYTTQYAYTGSFNVQINPDHLVVVSAAPTSVVAGATFGTTVEVVDNLGRVDTSYTGPVTLSLSANPALDTLGGTVTLNAVNGVATFTNLSLTKAVSGDALQVSSGILGTVADATLTVTPATASRFAVSGVPATTAGAAQSVQVVAYDAYGNVATGYTGTVHFTTSDVQAVLPADYTFQTGDAGSHAFSVTLKTAGTQSITTTDTTVSSVTGAETGIAVSSAVTTTLVLSGLPPSTVAGTGLVLTVRAEDAFGNTTPGYTGAVQLTSSDAKGVLPANYTFTAADAGIHTFSVTLVTAGPAQVVQATDAAQSTITGATPSVAVSPATAAALVVAVPPTATAGTAANVPVAVTDTYGNFITNYAGKLHFTSTDPKVILPADYTFVAGDAGQHTFTVTFETSGAQSITASDTNISALKGNSSAVAVSPAATSLLVVSGLPASTVAGASLVLIVTAVDTFGNTTPAYAGTVHFTATDPKATLPADYTFTAGDAGVHAFSATLVTAVPVQLIQATDTAHATITGATPSVAVSPATAAALVVAVPPTATAGTAVNVPVAVTDTYGNFITNYAGKLHFTSTDPKVILPADYTFVAGDAGEHTFTVTLETSGAQTITASDMNSSALKGTSSAVAVSPAATSSLVVGGLPANAVAGASLVLTVTAVDAFGNTTPAYTGAVHFNSGDTKAVLPSDYTFTAADKGSHSFGVVFRTAAPGSAVRGTDTAHSAITGATPLTAVTPGAPAALGLTYPATATAGTTLGSVVTVTDAFGNVVVGYTGKVHFTSSDAQAALPADYTFTTADAGVHIFSVVLKTVGTQWIAVADTAQSSLSGAHYGITVIAAGAQFLVITGFPTAVTAGPAQGFSISVTDAYGNAAPTYVGTAHFTTNSSKALLPADYTFTAADKGVHAFSAALFTAAPAQSVRATDTLHGSITGTTPSVTVSPAAASVLALGPSAATTAGAAVSVPVTVTDAYGNVVPGYAGKVHFSSTDTKAVLPADYTFVAADAGKHTFAVTLETAGPQTVKATDTVQATLTGTSPAVTVNPAATAALIVGGLPASTVAGTGLVLAVRAVDAFGNTTPGYTGTVHFTSNDSKAALPADYTFMASDAGQHSFVVTLKTASGSTGVRGTDTAHSGITGVTSAVAVSAGGATTVGLVYPSTPAAGTVLGLVVTVGDAFGNLATGYTGTLHFTTSDPQVSSLLADYTFTAADAGKHTFGAALRTAGSQSITATDTKNSALKSTQSGIAVQAAGAQFLVISAFPTTTVAGTAQGMMVSVTDSFHNPVPSYAGTVHFTSDDNHALLPPDYTFTAADAGVHIFAATLTTSGTYVVRATDTLHGSITGLTPTVNVTPAAAKTVRVSGYPAATNVGTANNFTIALLDAYGNIATGYSGTITIVSDDTTAVIAPSSYTFIAADAGQHTFSATFNKKGTHYLKATGSNNSALTGAEFGIVVS